MKAVSELLILLKRYRPIYCNLHTWPCCRLFYSMLYFVIHSRSTATEIGNWSSLSWNSLTLMHHTGRRKEWMLPVAQFIPRFIWNSLPHQYHWVNYCCEVSLCQLLMHTCLIPLKPLQAQFYLSYFWAFILQQTVPLILQGHLLGSHPPWFK